MTLMIPFSVLISIHLELNKSQYWSTPAPKLIRYPYNHTYLSLPLLSAKSLLNTALTLSSIRHRSPHAPAPTPPPPVRVLPLHVRPGPHSHPSPRPRPSILVSVPRPKPNALSRTSDRYVLHSSVLAASERVGCAAGQLELSRAGFGSGERRTAR